MASSQHVELEAAKFLQKLIQDSKDEPAKLATKLFVICQHMKLSGKEQSLPYQVISRAMETVINQHGLDIEVLKQARLPGPGPGPGGPQIGDTSNARSMEKDTSDNQMQVGGGGSDMHFRGTPVGPWQGGSSSKTREDVYGGSGQSAGSNKSNFVENEMMRHDSVNPNRPLVGPNRGDGTGHEFYQGSVSQRSSGLFEHESPSSLDTRSANSQERRDSAKPGKGGGRKKETKKPSVKRKRGDSTSGVDANTDNLGNPNTAVSSRKGKMMNKGDVKSQFSDRSGGDQAQVNPNQGIGNMEHFSSVPTGRGSIFRVKQDDQSSNLTSKPMEEGEMLGHGSVGLQKGGPFQYGHDIVNPRSVWDQFKVGLPSENSQISRFAPNNSSSSMKEIYNTQLAAPGGTNKETKTNAFEFSGHPEGAILNKGGKFWRQPVPYSAQTIGAESHSNEAEQGAPGRSLDTVNINISQGMTGLTGSISKNHGGVPGTFNPYGMVKTGFSSPVQFSSSSFDSHDIASKLHKERNMEASSGSQLLEMNKGTKAFDTSQKFLSVQPSVAKVDSEHLKHGFSKDSESSISERGMGARLGPANREEETSASPSSGKDLEQDGVISHKVGNAYKMVQVSGSQGPLSKGSLDAGKVSLSQAIVSSGMPFREQHLKQLRAQCLVFLAFRNGLVPRKLHLEIALGDGYPKEGGNADGAYRDLNRSDDTTASFGRSSDTRETDRVPPGSSQGALGEADSSPKDIENPMNQMVRKGQPSDNFILPEEDKPFASVRSKCEAEIPNQETAEVQETLPAISESECLMNNRRISSESNHERDDSVGNGNQVCSVLGMKQLNPALSSMAGIVSHNEASKETSVAPMFQHEAVPERIDTSLNKSETLGDMERVNQMSKPEFPVIQENQHTDKFPSGFSLKEQIKPVSRVDDTNSRDGNAFFTNVPRAESTISSSFGNAFVGGGIRGIDDQRISDTQSEWNSDSFKMVTPDDASNHGNSLSVLETYTEQEENDESVSTDRPPSPMYTTSEKWIMEYQKRKHLDKQNLVAKQKKTEEKITVCFKNLKETVSSSENTSAKTKSVIELKKLQLLQLQRRLRSDFLHDFLKPILPDMDRLKSIKKHRHGRRVKQLEKYEQKMKEERLKRIRERQKEFFSEIEAHKERLEDWFKIKRERSKSFNKYVKEFHKRKERIHREKLDRIQREKINLLKNNDVEGYLRMVQDAKSDRVKQLLKETEKYLQKLGSKLQEAKSMARRFEMEMDENRAANIVEKNEIAVEIEDENDQAEHYLESNEKYYLMAHSIKESITEQPTSLRGGKLREYQMNGLRWLVSLYNNHLNGILADEMGLGKTVQVIALICYLMEAKNDRGPFLVVVPSSVLPGWETEMKFWAPGINKIAYCGPPEERRRLFKERIIPQKFNVLVTTYEYLMNKHDRPKLSKVHWHYIIIDEGHRIKNASCKLNADLKHYQSTHRLLLTGTPLQNNLEELWALLNFLLPNIFNSSEDFSQWFNKPFESGGDTSPDQALLSEEENLLIINRLHQVLRPFVLRRLKHKVENELPEKIERLVRCEASAYQKLLMKRVEDNLGTIGSTKGRAVHNSVMELRNICNHPYISQLHSEEVDSLIPKHFLPPIVRLCGKLEMLDRLLPKLKATDHRVLFFSTMTRLLDVMEEYLRWKQYRYLRLDGHTSGSDRGALIEEFNRPDSPVFIFLLSIRAGGVGVNLQAADTVIIFDTDWNPQVDLQAQARAHRIGQKKDVLVLRLETVRTVEEQVRAAAEHKLGVANQSITAGFFDNNTSAEDRREYLESLLRECKKEEAAHVLDDDALNDLLARSESEIDVFEAIDKQRREEEMGTWKMLVEGPDKSGSEPSPPMPSRLVTDDDLKELYKAMQIYEESNVGVKRQNEYLGGLDTQHYGRGKRAREVRSYEDQWTEEEFEKMCQADSPESPRPMEEMKEMSVTIDTSVAKVAVVDTGELVPYPAPPPPLHLQSVEAPTPAVVAPPSTTAPQLQPQAVESSPPLPRPPVAAAPSMAPQLQPAKAPQQPLKRGRGRPKRATTNNPPSPAVLPETSLTGRKLDVESQRALVLNSANSTGSDIYSGQPTAKGPSGMIQPEFGARTASSSLATNPDAPVINPVQGSRKKTQSGSQAPRRWAKKQNITLASVSMGISSISGVPKDTSVTSVSSLAPAFALEKQGLSGQSGTPNLPSSAGSMVNPISRNPTAQPLASDRSSAAVAQDNQRATARPSGTSNAPTIVSFEVNPISGLRKMVELVPVRTPIPSFGQVKSADVVSSLDKKETDGVPQVCGAKESLPECTSTAADVVNLGVMLTGKEQKVDQSSPPAISALAQDLIERRTLRMGSMDASNKKQDLCEKPELASVENIPKTLSGFDGSNKGLSISSSVDNTMQMGHPLVKPADVAIRQESVRIGSAPVVRSQDGSTLVVRSQEFKNPKRLIRASARQTRSSAEKDISKTPPPARRGSRKKDTGVPNNKQPVSEMSNTNMVEVETTSARSYLAGPVVADDKRISTQAIIEGEKHEINTNKSGHATSGETSSSHPDMPASEASLTEKPGVSTESKQHLDLALVQKNAAIPVDDSACMKENENQLSVQMKEEKLAVEAVSAQISVVANGQPRADGMNNSTSVEKISCDMLTTGPVASSLGQNEEGREDGEGRPGMHEVAVALVSCESSTVAPTVHLEHLKSATVESVSPSVNLPTNKICDSHLAEQNAAACLPEVRHPIEGLEKASASPVVHANSSVTEPKTEPLHAFLENSRDPGNLSCDSTVGPSEVKDELVSVSVAPTSNLLLKDAEFNCDVSVSGIHELALDVEAGSGADICSVSKDLNSPVDNIFCSQNEVSDLVETAATGSVPMGVTGKNCDVKKFGGSSLPCGSVIPEQAASVSTCYQVCHPIQQIVDPPNNQAKVHSAGIPNQENRSKVSDFTKPEEADVRDRSDVLDSHTTAPSIPTPGEMSQLDEFADSACILGEEDRSTASDFSKPEEASVHYQNEKENNNEALDSHTTAPSISTSGKRSQLDVPAESLGSDASMHQHKADDLNGRSDIAAPSQIKAPDHLVMVSSPIAFSNEPKVEHTLGVSDETGEVSDQVLENVEKAGVGVGCTTNPQAGPVAQVNNALNCVSSNENKVQGHAPETTDLRTECSNQDFTHLKDADGGEGLPNTPTEPILEPGCQIPVTASVASTVKEVFKLEAVSSAGSEQGNSGPGPEELSDAPL